MRSEFYKPKELLSALIEVDDRLKSTIEKHCPDKDFKLSGDVDVDLQDFLQLTASADNDVAYLSSQLALLHLRKEMEKTIEVIVEVNGLRAHHDFNLMRIATQKEVKEKGNDRSSKKLVLIGLLGGLVIAFALFLFVL